MLIEQIKNIKPRHASFIISKSKLYPYIISLLTIAISYYFSLYYVNGDQTHYTGFYNDIKGVDIFTAFFMYKNYLDSSEPIYFIIVFLVSRFIEKNVFMSLINGVFMFYISKLLISQKVNKIFILSFIFNFYILGLFLAAERLKFSLLFFVLFIYYSQKNKTSIFFLILSILSHVQTIILLFSAYINKLIKALTNIFVNLRIKNASYIIMILSICVSFLYFLKDHIISKLSSYVIYGFDISNIIKPTAFLMFTFFIYKRNFAKLFFMFLPMIVGSYFLGETRIVIYAYFLFLYLCFKRSSSINIFIFITSIYFTYKGVVFLNNIIVYCKC